MRCVRVRYCNCYCCYPYHTVRVYTDATDFTVYCKMSRDSQTFESIHAAVAAARGAAGKGRDSMSFSDAYKRLQRSLDRQSSTSLADKLVEDQLPSVIIGAFALKEASNMSCSNDDEAMAIVGVVLTAHYSDAEELEREMRKFRGMIRGQHLNGEARAHLGLDPLPVEDFSFDSAVELDPATSEPSAHPVVSDSESDDGEEDDYVHVIRDSAPRGGALTVEQQLLDTSDSATPDFSVSIVSESDSETPASDIVTADTPDAPGTEDIGDLALQLPSMGNEQFTAEDIDTVGNEVSVQEVDVEILEVGAKSEPPATSVNQQIAKAISCDIHHSHPWINSEDEERPGTFAGLSIEGLCKCGVPSYEMTEMMLCVLKPDKLSQMDLCDCMRLIRATPTILMHMTGVPREDTDSIEQYVDRVQKHGAEIARSLCFPGQMQLIFLLAINGKAPRTPLTHHAADSAHRMLLATQAGGRAHGGGSATSDDDGVGRWPKIRKYLSDKWRSLTAPAGVPEQQGSTGDPAVDDLDGQLKHMDRNMAQENSDFRSHVRTIGRNIRQMLEKYRELAKSTSIADRSRSARALVDLKRYLQASREGMQKNMEIMQDNDRIMLTTVKERMDMIDQQLADMAISSEVTPAMLEQTWHTAKLLEEQPVAMSDMVSGRKVYMDRRKALEYIDNQTRKLKWFFYNPQQYNKDPYELSAFIALLGMLPGSPEVDAVRQIVDDDAWNSPDVFVHMPKMSNAEQYAFRFRMLEKIQDLMVRSIANDVSVGQIMNDMYIKQQLSVAEISQVLSFMRYLNSIAHVPISGVRSVGQANGAAMEYAADEYGHVRRAEPAFVQAALELYKQHLRVDRKHAESFALVQVSRLLQAFMVSHDLIGLVKDEPELEELRKDYHYYQALIYNNMDEIQPYLSAKHDLLFGDHVGRREHDIVYTSSDDDDGYTQSSSDEEYDEPHGRAEALVSETLDDVHHEHEIRAEAGHSPCLTMAPPSTMGHKHLSVLDHSLLHQMLGRCQNWHSICHVSHHFGIHSGDLSDVIES